jgi:alpha-beta hydrolase superfamily lysophospholipase
MSASGDQLPAGEEICSPVCLALQPEPVLGFLHRPAIEARGATAVMLCPPFGWDEMCSYRSRRTWAQTLARAGHPTVRFSLPGTGDSGGSPRDPAQLEGWSSAVTGVAAWLRERTQCARVVVIGIGLGGLVACKSVAGAAPIDDMILWSVPARGRALLREIRVQASMIAARYPADAGGSPELPDGDVEAVGFLLTAETAHALEEVQLTDLALPEPEQRRVMLLGRDRLGVDRRLRAYFEATGAEVTVADGSGYGAMMGHPQQAKTPVETIAKTVSWLARPADARRSAVGASIVPAVAAGDSESIELSVAGKVIRETPLSFAVGAGELFGVLSEPSDRRSADVCAVLLNAGALRHIGPNRAWVELARRWATMGVPSVRLDLEGIGDSDGDERRYAADAGFYIPERTEQTLAVIDQLKSRGLPNRYVLLGHCSGAYWALHAALADERVAGALMINLYSLYWSEALVAEREPSEALSALGRGGWRRLARRDVSADKLRQAILSVRPGRIRVGARGSVERAQIDAVNAALDRLRDQDTEALLLLGQDEPLHRQLARYGHLDSLERWPNLRVERIPSRDHMLRALWLQNHVHDRLDRALERVLAQHSAKLAAPASATDG